MKGDKKMIVTSNDIDILKSLVKLLETRADFDYDISNEEYAHALENAIEEILR